MHSSRPRGGSRGQGARGLVGLLLLLVILATGPAVNANPPSGFTDTEVALVSFPTALDFLPDGQILVASKSGQLSLIAAEGGAPTEILDLSASLCDKGERGLLGVAVDPEVTASQHKFVYLYYTFKRGNTCPVSFNGPTAGTPVNRVSRFSFTAGPIDPSSEEILIDGIPSPQENHNAGDLMFGPDGLLYISVGDGGNGATAADPSRLNGKILRIQPNGAIPTGNPYAGGAACNVSGRTQAKKSCREIFARGLRNPFRIALDLDSPSANPRLFINDVGASAWEGESGGGRRELRLGRAGRPLSNWGDPPLWANTKRSHQSRARV